MIPSTPTTARLYFLERAGYDVRPDPANIPELHRSGWSVEQIAQTYAITPRTVYRYLADKHPCPGYPEGSCLTKVRGGGLCSYCRKTRGMR